MADSQTVTSLHKRQFILFCIVGASGVLVNMAVFAAVLWALPKDALGSATTHVAAVAGWIASVTSNFILNDRLTFAAHDFHHVGVQRLWRYYLGALSGLGLQLGILTLALRWLPVEMPLPMWNAARKLLGNLTGIGVGTIANYVVARFWVFRKRAV